VAVDPRTYSRAVQCLNYCDTTKTNVEMTFLRITTIPDLTLTCKNMLVSGPRSDTRIIHSASTEPTTESINGASQIAADGGLLGSLV